MKNINKVFIAGNLTREPELRSMANGTSVLRFGIAVNDSRKNAQGQYEDYPNFVDCAIFGRRADSLDGYLAKGMKVCIEGKLRYSKWKDTNGYDRSKLEVIVDEIELPPRSQSESRAQNQQKAQPPYQPPHMAPQMASQQPYPAPYAVDDIPF